MAQYICMAFSLVDICFGAACRQRCRAGVLPAGYYDVLLLSLSCGSEHGGPVPVFHKLYNLLDVCSWAYKYTSLLPITKDCTACHEMVHSTGWPEPVVVPSKVEPVGGLSRLPRRLQRRRRCCHRFLSDAVKWRQSSLPLPDHNEGAMV